MFFFTIVVLTTARELGGEVVCSKEELQESIRCWHGSFASSLDVCCSEGSSSTTEAQCWDVDFTASVCCRCLGNLSSALQSVREISGQLLATLSVSTTALSDARRELRDATRKLEDSGADLGALLEVVRHSQATLDAVENLADPTAEEDHVVALVCQIYVLQRSRIHMSDLRSTDCLTNLFSQQQCAGPHPAAFEHFPPVQGPPLAGQILDFLGVSTNENFFCNRRILAGDAPSRAIECINHATQTSALRQWPVFDEDHFEWADVLGAAVAAARYGKEFSIAEVGCGPYAIWGTRAAVAYDRLSPTGVCNLLLVEPEALEDKAALRAHLASNLPADRCRVTVMEEKVGQRQSAPLWKLLDRTGVKVWDLVDMDVQGGEVQIIREELEQLATRVRRLHVQTHTKAEHREIVQRLRGAGWTVPLEIPAVTLSHVDPYGALVTMDGHLTAFPPTAFPPDCGRSCLSEPHG